MSAKCAKKGVLEQEQNTLDIELDLLLEAIHRFYGYDFSQYARASVCRRVDSFLAKEKLDTPSQLIPRILHDKFTFDRLLTELSITVTDFFRDPTFFEAVTETVFPILRTYPFFKIWHAGCATGEEVYSLAILLKEANLLERAKIYATDYNKQAIGIAKRGVYGSHKLEESSRAYHQAGGTDHFGHYYQKNEDKIIFDESLKKGITFAYHNLVKDGVFGEMNLVVCRNVLIYFDKELRDRTLSLFDDSLAKRGFICLGAKETLSYTIIHKKFESVSEPNNIFRRGN